MILNFAFGIIVFAFLGCIAFTPMHAILGMLLAYLITGMLLLFIGFEFLGLIFIAIYAGAVVILFIFALMLTNYPASDSPRSSPNRLFYYFLGYLFVVSLTWQFYSKFLTYALGFKANVDYMLLNSVLVSFTQNELNMFGEMLYSSYAAWLLAVALVLFIALVSVVVSTAAYKRVYLRRRVTVVSGLVQ